MTLMVQREFYFANGFSLSGGKFILQTKFYDFVAICYAAGKTYFLIRPICSCCYSVKEQTRLVTYAVHCPHSEEGQPAALFRPKTQFLKGRHTPAFSFTPCTIYHRTMRGINKSRQFNRPTWVDRDGTDLNLIAKLFIFTHTLSFAFIFYWQVDE